MENENSTGFDDMDEVDGEDAVGCGMVFHTDTDEEFKRRARQYAKIAEKFGDPEKVLVGQAVSKRADYAALRLHVTIETPMYSEDMRGTVKTQAYIDCESLGNLVELYNYTFTGSLCDAFYAVERETGRIVGRTDIY